MVKLVRVKKVFSDSINTLIVVGRFYFLRLCL